MGSKNKKKAEEEVAPIRIAPVRKKGPSGLYFTFYAWQKLVFMARAMKVEVGGYAMVNPEDPLQVVDIWIPKQDGSKAFVKFDEDDVSKKVDEFQKQGIDPWRCMRIWIHTHPGSSAQPSGTDKETFADIFQRSSWGVMFIIARDNLSTYALLKIRAPLDPEGVKGVSLQGEIEVVYEEAHEAVSVDKVELDFAGWDQEMRDNVEISGVTQESKGETKILSEEGKSGSNSKKWKDECFERTTHWIKGYLNRMKGDDSLFMMQVPPNGTNRKSDPAIRVGKSPSEQGWTCIKGVHGGMWKAPSLKAMKKETTGGKA